MLQVRTGLAYNKAKYVNRYVAMNETWLHQFITEFYRQPVERNTHEEPYTKLKNTQ